MTETTVRPNGKVYRPRRRIQVEEFETPDEGTGIMVLRTHNVMYASLLAARALHNLDLDPAKPILTWVKDVPWDDSGMYDYSWVYDPVRGIPVVYWNPENPW